MKAVSMISLGLGVFLLVQVVMPLASYGLWEISHNNQNVPLLDPTQNRRGEVLGKLEGDMKVSLEGLVENITKQSFSKKVGDQASDFSLTLAIDYKGTAYSDSDFKTMAAKSIDTTLPDGYELNLAESETQATATKVEKDGRLVFDVTFRAKLSPKLDQEALKKQIVGKSVGEATNILKGTENVIGVVYEFSPSFAKVLGRLPFWPGNINISVVTK